MVRVIRFDDTEYRFNHGAAPRGRGSWAFVFVVGYSAKRDYTNDEVWFSPGALTLGEAKKAARVEAVKRLPDAQVIAVTVCS